MQLTKRMTLWVCVALAMTVTATDSAQAGVIPWAYSAIFGPPGSLAQWRAQALQNRAMRISMRRSRGGLFAGRGYGYGGYSAAYGQGCYTGCSTGYTPYYYYGGGCSTGGCLTGCPTTVAPTTTYYAPYSYGYGGCQTTGCTTNYGVTSGCNTCGYSSILEGCPNGNCGVSSPSVITPASGISKDTPSGNNDGATGGDATLFHKPSSTKTPPTFATEKKPMPDPKMSIPSKNNNNNNYDGFMKPRTSNKVITSEPTKEKTPKEEPIKLKLAPQEEPTVIRKKVPAPTMPEEKDEADKEEKESTMKRQQPQPLLIKPQIAWSGSVQRTRLARSARFTLPTVARTNPSQMRPIDIILQAETQVASNR